jgi:hypothetical protein
MTAFPVAVPVTTYAHFLNCTSGRLDTRFSNDLLEDVRIERKVGDDLLQLGVFMAE